MIEAILLIATVGAGELIAWRWEILWHRSEPKRDPRNGI